MTNDLISRNALHSMVCLDSSRGTYGEFTDGSEVSFTANEVHAMINEVIAVDAVAVVRCKDCAWCKNPFPEHFPQKLECMRFDMEVAADEFCSRSERRADK